MTITLPATEEPVWSVQHLVGFDDQTFSSGVLTALSCHSAAERHVLVTPNCVAPETYNARILELRDHNVDATFLRLDDLELPTHDPDTPPSPTRAGHKLRNALADSLAALVSKHQHKVLILAGGFTPESLKSTTWALGHLSSERLAAFVATGLRASELVLWKEVDGVFTSDPLKVPTARLLPILSFPEMAELANRSPDICDAGAIKQAYHGRVPVRIRNINNFGCQGTLIHSDPETTPQAKVSSISTETFQGRRISDFAKEAPKQTRLPTAVTIREHVVLIDISSHFETEAQGGFVSEVFSTLNRHPVAVDLISTSETHVSVAIHAVTSGTSLHHLIHELEECGTVSVREGMTILSLIGRQMPSMIGIAGQMFTTLARRNINIEMMSQSASEINISCVINGKDAMKALNLVHHSCLGKMNVLQ
ncbi:hypothetical protein HGRIS_000175 [Hohenbuehelia grisea]|uniref:aspartate kinase n=1 Tax=Hohenbuehelia grisea TaxID=104357 RepID=A0ABR3JS49_9AGAR